MNLNVQGTPTMLNSYWVGIKHVVTAAIVGYAAWLPMAWIGAMGLGFIDWYFQASILVAAIFGIWLSTKIYIRELKRSCLNRVFLAGALVLFFPTTLGAWAIYPVEGISASLSMFLPAAIYFGVTFLFIQQLSK